MLETDTLDPSVPLKFDFALGDDKALEPLGGPPPSERALERIATNKVDGRRTGEFLTLQRTIAGNDRSH